MKIRSKKEHRSPGANIASFLPATQPTPWHGVNHGSFDPLLETPTKTAQKSHQHQASRWSSELLPARTNLHYRLFTCSRPGETYVDNNVKHGSIFHPAGGGLGAVEAMILFVMLFEELDKRVTGMVSLCYHQTNNMIKPSTRHWFKCFIVLFVLYTLLAADMLVSLPLC